MIDKNQEVSNEINVKELLEIINGIEDDIAELNNKLNVVIGGIDIINNTLQLLTNAPKESDNFSNNNSRHDYYISKYLYDIRSILGVIAKNITTSNNKELKYSDYYTKNDDDSESFSTTTKNQNTNKFTKYTFDQIIKNKFGY